MFSSIVNNKLWFSDPNSFNDPFDCNLKIEDNFQKEEIEDYYKLAYWKKQKGIDTEWVQIKTSQKICNLA